MSEPVPFSESLIEKKKFIWTLICSTLHLFNFCVFFQQSRLKRVMPWHGWHWNKSAIMKCVTSLKVDHNQIKKSVKSLRVLQALHSAEWCHLWKLPNFIYSNYPNLNYCNTYKLSSFIQTLHSTQFNINLQKCSKKIWLFSEQWMCGLKTQNNNTFIVLGIVFWQ